MLTLFGINLISVNKRNSCIKEITEYSANDSLGFNIKFNNGLQLSIVDDSTPTSMEFELAIYDENSNISPIYFDHVIDVLRGCNVKRVEYYIDKLSSLLV